MMAPVRIQQACTIQVRPYPLLDPTPKQAVVCQGQPLRLQANVDAGTQVSWTNYNISNPPHRQSGDHSGSRYHLPCNALTSFGCTHQADVAVTVGHRFEVNTADVSICHGDKVQLNAGGAVRYKWVPEAGLSRADINDPIAGPENTTTYRVIGFGKDALLYRYGYRHHVYQSRA